MRTRGAFGQTAALVFELASKSLWHRRIALSLLVLAMSLSCALLFFIERLRIDMKTSFAQSVSGTDLLVGPKGHPAQLLLSTVFHLGEPRDALPFSSLQWLADLPSVAWTVPISLGDSHGPYRVIGTQSQFFEHIRTGEAEPLRFTQGKGFSGLWELVVGASVAKQLGYKLDASIILEHGLPSEESTSGAQGGPRGFGSSTSHDDKPFRVVGVLAPTGTALDRSLLVSLESIEALHIGWQAGAPIPGLRLSEDMIRKFDLSPKQISAIYVGLKQRSLLFRTQRQIETSGPLPMTAAAPGLALADLWQLIAKAEAAFSLLAVVMLLVAMLGMGANLLASMRERERELALLRVLGARPWQIAALVLVEALLAASLALLVALSSLSSLLLIFKESLLTEAGLTMSAQWIRDDELPLMAAVYACAFVVSLLPAWRAYRISLQQGMLDR